MNREEVRQDELIISKQGTWHGDVSIPRTAYKRKGVYFAGDAQETHSRWLTPMASPLGGAGRFFTKMSQEHSVIYLGSLKPILPTGWDLRIVPSETLPEVASNCGLQLRDCRQASLVV